MHRAFVLLQVAEVLALLPPARVRDLARRLGTNPGGDDILQSVAQLRPADAKRVVAEADGKAELECADCHARSLARAARDGATYCCTGCHSPAVNIVGAQPMKPLSDDSSSSGRATDDASGGISLTRRLSRSGPAVVLPADRHWQTVPFRNAGPFSLRHVIGNYDLKHARAVSAVAIPPGGSDLVASGGFDHTVKLWDARSGREVVNLGTHRRRVTALATTPGGDTLISGGLDGRVIFWNLSTTRALARLDVKSPLHSLSVSADGRLLALGVESSTARLISARSARPRRELNFPGMKGALAVALNRDGSHLAAAGTGGAQVAVRDVDSGRELLTFTAREPVAHLAFLDGNHLLIVGATTAQILRAGTLTATALDTGSAGPGQRITAVNVTPDGQRIVFGFADGAVRVLAHTGSKVREIRAAHPSRVHAVALDNDMLVSGGADHSVRLWSCSGGQERIAPTGHRGQILRVAVSLPDFLTGGARILSVGEDATARITDVAGGSEVQCYDGHLRAI
ncbi:MAG: WD40 repeat domain-containing protein, partial [Planctomycetota bacterium]